MEALVKGGGRCRQGWNLRPLPCQIPRAFAGLYVGWVEIGKVR
jgi:hypothetical protein